MTRNKLVVNKMQVNVQFLQQLQPEWTRFVTIVKQAKDLETESYHVLFDILKQYQGEANEIRAERFVRISNPLALMTTTQHQNSITSSTQTSTHPTSTRYRSSSRSTTSHKSRGKEPVRAPSPISDSESSIESDDDSARWNKNIENALLSI